MATYAELNAALDDAEAQLVNAIKRAKSGKNEIGVSNTTIGGLGAQYGDVVTAINALAVAEPANAAVLALKARKDRLVTDFGTVKTAVQAMVDGLSGLDPS